MSSKKGGGKERKRNIAGEMSTLTRDSSFEYLIRPDFRGFTQVQRGVLGLDLGGNYSIRFKR